MSGRRAPGVAGTLPRSFYARDVLDVAPDLLGCVLVRGARRARIVEVEAYRGADDAASHAHRGRTRRNAVMFGPPGHLYVYFSYGMHWCANVVCGSDSEAMAVLLRAAEPIAGLDEMRALRPTARHDRELLRGPARLARAFGVTGDDDGADLVEPAAGGLTLLGREQAPGPVVAGPRIGIRRAVDLPWRFHLAGSPYVSR